MYSRISVAVLGLIAICLTGCGHKVMSRTSHPLSPKINAPYRVGIHPGTPFMHAVGTSGPEPMHYTADDLPEGLRIDPQTGIIRGVIEDAGTYTPTITAENKYGRATRQIEIVAGDTLALTPPMGWMTWNKFQGDISEQLIMEIADAMVETGLRDAGYEYIIIDDLWQGKRDEDGNIQPDPEKFPSGIKKLADYVHAKGLKLGIYSDAAEWTCAGAIGSLGYEQQDADTFAEWGIDYLKYDYCHAPKDVETAKKRYSKISDALDATDRSIVLGICEWGPRKPWLWGREVGGNLWRTTWDIRDTWDAGSYSAGCNGIVQTLDRHTDIADHAGPGGWNDPDMLIVGLYGKGKPSNACGASGCTDREYRSQMSLWCLLAAPLTISCDVRDMTPETRYILTNDEAIAIDQDPLGEPARRVHKDGPIEIWARPLADGSWAVGLLNKHDEEAKDITFDYAMVDLEGTAEVRDVWAHMDMGEFTDSYTDKVEPHETKLIIVKP
ncbi:Alpha-galactosidase A precursor [Anaerohalosphaera lusitana]|uniref:Alpha-galactosidase n=1 Tax=Anaerohalosphaera lusitana TaxID=1936003 RepID=A0A1U9NH29_9BACT|nr:alpha-galactosidase [Anaerohalosphaera lusitana]AQT67229.1 Alpha-galactosidase A precursor [Anaerohalosphaera lusitana]